MLFFPQAWEDGGCSWRIKSPTPPPALPGSTPVCVLFVLPRSAPCLTGCPWHVTISSCDLARVSEKQRWGGQGGEDIESSPAWRWGGELRMNGEASLVLRSSPTGPASPGCTTSHWPLCPAPPHLWEMGCCQGPLREEEVGPLIRYAVEACHSDAGHMVSPSPGFIVLNTWPASNLSSASSTGFSNLIVI